MVIKCPRCGIALTETEYRPGTPVFWCGLCSGLWVNGSELYEIFEISENADFQAVSREARTCPGCGNPLFYTVKFPGTEIAVDICEKCKGIWFDRGELQKIKAFVQEGKMEKPVKAEPASERAAGWINNLISNLMPD
ncbi:MAG: zf-TFIIB domain-containing protein [Candidatus Omnitrophica bacterium]|nr:zf-TFIIB domain-containing protein [Candidatus Omnitrophota bacterium]